jgi:hypothetical protein
MSTRQEIVALALNIIGVAATDDPVQASDYATTNRVLDGVFAELQGPWGGCTFDFALEAVPSAYLMPLARMLAVRVAPLYARPEPEPEKTALVRIRAVNLPYVRDMDYDEDGTTTQVETDAFDAGAYF